MTLFSLSDILFNMKYTYFVISVVFLLLAQSCFNSEPVKVNSVQKKTYGKEITLDFSESHDKAKVKWIVPMDWIALQHNSLLKARYKIGDNCFVSISSFPGLAGGLLNNINRWRQQLNLNPIKFTELSEFCDTLTTSDFTFTLVSLDASHVDVNDQNYIFTGIFYYENETWFVKAVGTKSVLHPLVSDIKQFLSTFTYL